MDPIAVQAKKRRSPNLELWRRSSLGTYLTWTCEAPTRRTWPGSQTQGFLNHPFGYFGEEAFHGTFSCNLDPVT